MGEEPSIYLVLSEIEGLKTSLLASAREAIEGGISWLQLRIKGKRRRELLPLGRALRVMCQDAGVKFIVNDDPVLARRLRADGVHLGQEDVLRFSLRKARRLLGKSKIIGISTHSLDQAKKAVKEDVDYIAFGPLFPTPNKPYHIGTQELTRVLTLTDKPVILIGGVNQENIEGLKAMGGKHFAMIRGILEAEDIKARVKELRAQLGIKGENRHGESEDKRKRNVRR